MDSFIEMNIIMNIIIFLSYSFRYEGTPQERGGEERTTEVRAFCVAKSEF